jgi:glycine/D-amino acid oxidase-like deaminating enzyme
MFYDRPTAELASFIAAGLIEPVAGTSDPAGASLELNLFAASYEAWRREAALRPDLVMRRRVTAYTTRRSGPLPWHATVDGYREVDDAELHPRYRDAQAAQFSSYVVDTPRWLAEGLTELRARGVTFVERHLMSLDELGEFDAVVNATGLAAAELVGDPELHRGNGHLAFVSRPAGFEDVFMDEQRDPAAVQADPFHANMLYAIPRAHDVVIGGTLFDAPATDREPVPIDGMASHLVNLLSDIEPRLRGTRLLGYRVGSRPRRTSGTRLEFDADTYAVPVVHCYGTGGSGWTLAPGIARSVVNLLQEQIPAQRHRAQHG